MNCPECKTSNKVKTSRVVGERTYRWYDCTCGKTFYTETESVYNDRGCITSEVYIDSPTYHEAVMSTLRKYPKNRLKGDERLRARGIDPVEYHRQKSREKYQRAKMRAMKLLMEVHDA